MSPAVIDADYNILVGHGRVTAAREEGYTPVSDVAANINEVLKLEKLQAKSVKDVAAKVEGMTDLQQIADALKSSVQTREDVAFGSTSAPAVEPALLGAIAKAPEGQLCGPVAGRACTYMFKVTKRETGSFYTAEDAATMEQNKARYTTQMIVPTMMEYDNVKDNRERFF